MVDTPAPAADAAPAGDTPAPAAAAPPIAAADVLYPAGEASTPAADPGADTTPAASDTQPGADTTAADTTASDTASGNDSVSGDDSQSGADSITAASYDTVKFADNIQVDDAINGQFKSILAEAKVEPAVAQKIADLLPNILTAQAKAQADAFAEVNAGWTREVNALPEFNTTAAREQSLTQIGRLIDTYGSPEVREIMDSTGAGNFPPLVKMFLAVAKALDEGAPARVGTPTGSGGAKTLGQRLYPDSN